MRSAFALTAALLAGFFAVYMVHAIRIESAIEAGQRQTLALDAGR